jgi:hypothetical protein
VIGMVFYFSYGVRRSKLAETGVRSDGSMKGKV